MNNLAQKFYSNLHAVAVVNAFSVLNEVPHHGYMEMLASGLFQTPTVLPKANRRLLYILQHLLIAKGNTHNINAIAFFFLLFKHPRERHLPSNLALG